MAQLRTFGAADPDTTAVCQQAALIACLYQGDRVRAEQLLGADGTVLAWVHRPESWPPSYAVIRSSSGHRYVVFTGTTNMGQGLAHVQGTFWRRATGDFSLVNGQWQQVVDDVYSEVRPHLPEDLNDTTTFISGHSYGGSVAHLLANRLVAESAPSRVQCMTFGEARSLTVGYAGPAPAIHWRIASTNDVVQFIPIDESLWGADPWLMPPGWLLLPTQWAHYGRGRSLSWDGGYGTIDPPPDPPPDGVSHGLVAEHLMGNYWGRLNQRLLNVESTPDAAAALAIMRSTLNQPPAQTVPGRLPGGVRIPPGLVEVPIPEPPAPPPVRSPIMANPAPPLAVAAEERVMHVTFFFQSGDQGWSENWYLHIKGVTDPYAPAEQWAQEMNAARKPALPVGMKIKATRVADPDNMRDASLIKAPNLQSGDGKRPGKAAYHEMGWTATANDATNQVSAPRIFRGWVQVDVDYAVYGGPNPEKRPDVVNAYWSAIVPLVTTTWSPVQNGPATVRALIRSYDRTKPKITVGNFALNTAGFLTFKVKGTQVPPFAIGDKIHLSHPRDECLKGLSGDTRIIDILTDVPGAYVYVTNKRMCCGAEKLAKALGTAQIRVPAYYPIDELNWGFISDKDTGAPFGLQRGRRRGKCC